MNTLQKLAERQLSSNRVPAANLVHNCIPFAPSMAGELAAIAGGETRERENYMPYSDKPRWDLRGRLGMGRHQIDFDSVRR